MEQRTVFERFLAVFYPEHCCCCGKVVTCGEIVCKDCRKRLLPIVPPICNYCGRSKSDCYCDKHRKHTERSVAPFYYGGAAKSALMRFKFYNKITSSELFVIAMTDTVHREYDGIRFDFIIPVPISSQTREKRGYNQSAVLAHGLSEKMQIPWNESLLKLWETKPQRELPAYRRSGNILGVFDMDGSVKVKEKTILLVDDINTTGSTLDECAKILKIYGACEVYAVTAAASYLSKIEK